MVSTVLFAVLSFFVLVHVFMLGVYGCRQLAAASVPAEPAPPLYVISLAVQQQLTPEPLAVF